MRKLLLQLTQNSDYVRWVQFDQLDEKSATLKEGTLREAAQESKGCEVWVVVPSVDILFTHVKMPKTMSQAQLERAVPFAIEDKLLTKIETHHFVIAKTPLSDRVSVAVVARERMNAWLKLLEENGLKATQIIPSIYVLPVQDRVWYGYEENQITTIRTHHHEGFAIDNSCLKQLISLRLQEENRINPNHLIIYTDVHMRSNVDWNTLPITVQTQPFQQADLIDFVKRLGSKDYINLLVGKYKLFSPSQSIGHLSVVLLSLALLWLTIKAGGNIGQYYALSQQQAGLEQDIGSLYKKVYPDAQNVVSPRLRLEQELKQLDVTGGGSIFFQLLNKIENSQVQSRVRVIRMGYENANTTLKLELQVPTFAQLKNFVAQLTANNLSVQQSKANSEKGVVIAELIIQAGGT